MKEQDCSSALGYMVMETISNLQKTHDVVTLNDIKRSIAKNYPSEKIQKCVPTLLRKVINLGLIDKHGDSYTRKVYHLKRGMGGKSGKRRRKSRGRRSRSKTKRRSKRRGR